MGNQGAGSNPEISVGGVFKKFQRSFLGVFCAIQNSVKNNLSRGNEMNETLASRPKQTLKLGGPGEWVSILNVKISRRWSRLKSLKREGYETLAFHPHPLDIILKWNCT